MTTNSAPSTTKMARQPSHAASAPASETPAAPPSIWPIMKRAMVAWRRS
jgi:hypothetical protein